MLHLDQLGHIVVVYPARSTKTIISARGGNDDGDDGGVHYLPPWPPLLSPINPMWWTIKNVGHQHSLQCCTKSRDACWSGPGPQRVPQSTWPVSTCPSTWGPPCPTIWSSSELMEDRLNIPDKAAALLRDQMCMCSLDPNGRSMGPMRDHQLWLSSSWYIFYSSDTVTSFKGFSGFRGDAMILTHMQL